MCIATDPSPSLLRHHTPADLVALLLVHGVLELSRGALDLTPHTHKTTVSARESERQGDQPRETRLRVQEVPEFGKVHRPMISPLPSMCGLLCFRHSSTICVHDTPQPKPQRDHSNRNLDLILTTLSLSLSLSLQLQRSRNSTLEAEASQCA